MVAGVKGADLGLVCPVGTDGDFFKHFIRVGNAVAVDVVEDDDAVAGIARTGNGQYLFVDLAVFDAFNLRRLGLCRRVDVDGDRNAFGGRRCVARRVGDDDADVVIAGRQRADLDPVCPVGADDAFFGRFARTGNAVAVDVVEDDDGVAGIARAGNGQRLVVGLAVFGAFDLRRRGLCGRRRVDGHRQDRRRRRRIARRVDLDGADSVGSFRQRIGGDRPVAGGVGLRRSQSLACVCDPVAVDVVEDDNVGAGFPGPREFQLAVIGETVRTPDEDGRRRRGRNLGVDGDGQRAGRRRIVAGGVGLDRTDHIDAVGKGRCGGDDPASVGVDGCGSDNVDGDAVAVDVIEQDHRRAGLADAGKGRGLIVGDIVRLARTGVRVGDEIGGRGRGRRDRVDIQRQRGRGRRGVAGRVGLDHAQIVRPFAKGVGPDGPVSGGVDGRRAANFARIRDAVAVDVVEQDHCRAGLAGSGQGRRRRVGVVWRRSVQHRRRRRRRRVGVDAGCGIAVCRLGEIGVDAAQAADGAAVERENVRRPADPIRILIASLCGVAEGQRIAAVRAGNEERDPHDAPDIERKARRSAAGVHGNRFVEGHDNVDLVPRPVVAVDDVDGGDVGNARYRDGRGRRQTVALAVIGDDGDRPVRRVRIVRRILVLQEPEGRLIVGDARLANESERHARGGDCESGLRRRGGDRDPAGQGTGEGNTLARAVRRVDEGDGQGLEGSAVHVGQRRGRIDKAGRIAFGESVVGDRYDWRVVDRADCCGYLAGVRGDRRRAAISRDVDRNARRAIGEAGRIRIVEGAEVENRRRTVEVPRRHEAHKRRRRKGKRPRAVVNRSDGEPVRPVVGGIFPHAFGSRVRTVADDCEPLKRRAVVRIVRRDPDGVQRRAGRVRFAFVYRRQDAAIGDDRRFIDVVHRNDHVAGRLVAGRIRGHDRQRNGGFGFMIEAGGPDGCHRARIRVDLEASAAVAVGGEGVCHGGRVGCGDDADCRAGAAYVFVDAEPGRRDGGGGRGRIDGDRQRTGVERLVAGDIGLEEPDYVLAVGERIRQHDRPGAAGHDSASKNRVVGVKEGDGRAVFAFSRDKGHTDIRDIVGVARAAIGGVGEVGRRRGGWRGRIDGERQRA